MCTSYQYRKGESTLAEKISHILMPTTVNKVDNTSKYELFPILSNYKKPEVFSVVKTMLLSINKNYTAGSIKIDVSFSIYINFSYVWYKYMSCSF